MENESIVINLNEVDENKASFTAIPKGNYECIVEDVDFSYSLNTNAPMLTWKFKIIDEEYKKRVLFNHNVLNSEFGVAMLKKTILALGLDLDMSSFNPEKFANEGDAIGMPICVKVGIQKYEGELRNNVKDVMTSKTLSGEFNEW